LFWLENQKYLVNLSGNLSALVLKNGFNLLTPDSHKYMINRILSTSLLERLNDPKILLLYGARQVGKSTLLQTLAPQFAQPVLWWNGDESDVRSMLENPTSNGLKSLIGNHNCVVIDEAQRIENIGICLKLIHDQLPHIKVIATGSSSFDLANRVKEPLTGRKWEFRIFPLMFEEMVAHHGLFAEKRALPQRLIYGYYPEIVNNSGDALELLKALSDSYLYKDVLIWERIQKPEKLEKLVQALAYQIGQEVRYTELGQLCGLNNETVERYIQILERAFVVFRLPAFSRNMRNELKKTQKIYFYDLGIRNAVIRQFAPLALRNDVGALWENFVIAERIKWIQTYRKDFTPYFWRTTAQQELDYVEEQNHKLTAIECKWNPKAKAKIPISFLNHYPEATFKVVTPENVEAFLLQ
jgi:uncharacterized protein